VTATAVLWIVALTAALPVVMLALECWIGAFAAAPHDKVGNAPPVIVVMPAHDEADGIGRAISAVLAQLRREDELLVIADNCSDDTAAIAERLGARVLVRHDPVQRGKGHALEFARAHMMRDPGAPGPGRIVLILDADCMPAPGAIHHAAAMAAKYKAVVQGAYLLQPPAGAGPLVRLSCFAFLVKNLVRQQALRRLAGAALLQGSGMAFPWPLFSRMDLQARSLVEDLELGLELLLGGEKVLFDGAAHFFSEAGSENATVGQRRRWEHGTMQAMSRHVPRLMRAALAGRPRLAVVALDQLVPPTALLIAVAGSLALLLAVLAGFAAPVVILFAALLLLGAGLAGAWARHGQSLVPPAMLGEAVRYLAWKLPIALQFVTRRERHWIRTERGP
jgi:cellulose synthase/poly-beta-1,6-N-acetylglucosamine synthase-like glycosyltransferase